MDKGATRRDFLRAMTVLPLASVPLCLPEGGAAVAAPAEPRRRFGTAVRPEQLNRAGPLRDAFDAHCDLLVPEYHGQWSAVEWRPGDPWYGNYDAIVAYAASRGAAVRGHSLIWEQMTPDWARAEMRHNRDWKPVERHFANLLPRYSGAIGEWVVVNEMIDTEDGHHDMRRTSFQRAFGNDYVRRALETAHALDPAAKLMINDYSLLHDNPVDEARRRAMLKLVESLLRAGTPLHAVGMQGHLELRKGGVDQKRVARFLDDLAATGVTLHITELDVLEDDRTLELARRDQRVADMVRSVLDVALDQPALKSVTTWGIDDGHSWLQDRVPATRAAQACKPMDCHSLNRGLPFDAALAAKPMLAALQGVRA